MSRVWWVIVRGALVLGVAWLLVFFVAVVTLTLAGYGDSEVPNWALVWIPLTTVPGLLLAARSVRPNAQRIVAALTDWLLGR